MTPTSQALTAFFVEHLETHGPTQRVQLVRAVATAWSSAGGAPLDEAKLTAKVKKILSVAQNDGVLDSPTRGWWALRDQEGAVLVPDVLASDEASVEDDEGPRESFSVGRTVGIGQHCVYAYYLQTYRDAALGRGSDRWAMKIGVTTGPLAIRMANHTTALPEPPVVALVIRHDQAVLLEKVIHGALALRGHRLEQSGGSEWFATNPAEIEAIYRAVVADQGTEEP